MQVHIVYMGEKPHGAVSMVSMHHSMLASVLGSTASAKESLIYSYGRSFNGFAAKLSDEEVTRFADMDGVVSVVPNSMLELHTTRSWDFMGFTQSHVRDSLGGDVIIGLLDTGIWPESESFSDEGFGPPPAKWKGMCQTENNFTCNNKIIGARYYNSYNEYYDGDIKSPRDSEGHGTHTASTAAGREVAGASFYGLAQGLARGGYPNARIAVYKVCWVRGCAAADILAAFDDAIADGVDIISVSLGLTFPEPYFEDVIAIGSFHAMGQGILTSTSAGNDGPWLGWVSNYSPWSLTVAASSIDRKFVSKLVLGNGQIFSGIVINNLELNGTYPLIWGGDAANVSAQETPLSSADCLPGDLDSRKVKGKIVLCEFLWDGSGVIMAGGVGIIMPAWYFNDFAFTFPLPATLLRRQDMDKVLQYARFSKNPIATILVGETRKDVMAPIVASFSSRGPNPISPDILKPDLTAPGVDILAAWSPIVSPSEYEHDTRTAQYNIISGTSMSCPHASGAAAYVKSIHPSWSPAAIKSALMTTAYVMDTRKNEDKEFAYGSGHINPVKAVDPGLIYNTSKADYINFLCKQGYNTSTLRLITGDDSVCNSTKPGRAWDLNYPSFSLAIEDGQDIMGIFSRTVTNVGSPNSTYHASVYMPNSIEIEVEPPVLSFSAIGEKKSFTVRVYGPQINMQPIISGAILWTDGVHVVRAPLAVYTVLPSVTSSYRNPSKQTKRPNLKASSSMKKSDLKGSSIYYKNGIF
ncbi:cucumisin [Vitis vinifera]|uniref:cucumisin n=1 Tax=Vitis vinifera TaxID=29760 RepID=UPI0028832DA8|nr:cucumisin [Vitis vinifera]